MSTTTADSPPVRFDQVTKRYGDHLALDRLDLAVAPSERVVIIGPSGSGKTTLLRTVMSLERPDEGEVWLRGQRMFHVERGGRLRTAPERHIREVCRPVSMVFQHFHLFPHLSVLDNITLGPIKARGVHRTAARERAMALLDRVGLADKAGAAPGQLSGGQQQRVAIARALAMEPEVMLFDEITSALDPELVGEVLDVVAELADSTSVAMLIVTHELGFAREVGDRIVMFDEGRIVESGDPSRVFEHPEQERTRSFLSAVDRYRR